MKTSKNLSMSTQQFARLRSIEVGHVMNALLNTIW